MGPALRCHCMPSLVPRRLNGGGGGGGGGGGDMRLALMILE